MSEEQKRAELMKLAADGKGHTATITKNMIDQYEHETKETASAPENTLDIVYIPHKPYRVELALGMSRGTIFTAADNEAVKKQGGFFNVKNGDFPATASCELLTKDECPQSGAYRCAVKGWIKSSCAFDERYLFNDIVPVIEKEKSIVLDIPVRAVLLDAARLLGRSDILFACDALITQFQRHKVTYGDLLAIIYIIHLCKKYNIQKIGCVQVRRYIWAMARADGNEKDRNSRVDFYSRIMYLRHMIGIDGNNKVTRFPEEDIDKKKLAFTALMAGGAVIGAHQAWNYGLQQNTAVNAQAPRQFEQQQQQRQRQQESTGIQFGPQNRPSTQPPQSQWYDMPPATFATDGQRAEYLLRDLPEFYSKAEARAYMNQHILPQLPPTEYTPLWGVPLRQPEQAVTRRMGDLIRILPE